MIRPEYFYNTLRGMGIDFYTGVPDSLLKDICAYITDHADRKNNIIAANEGGAVGLAAGYHLATGNIPVVYMQNSGLGNTVNPLMSLTDSDVYRIPVLLVIGWRGEPGVHDEPQHVKQGKTTLPLLDAMEIRHEIMSGDEAELEKQLAGGVRYMKETGRAFALVVKKGTFGKYKLQNGTHNPYTMEREEAIKAVAGAMDVKDIVVSTTGKISRELFEHRTATGEGHIRDFLTVGSMGHASQIALGIALNRPGRTQRVLFRRRRCRHNAHGRHGHSGKHVARELLSYRFQQRRARLRGRAAHHWLWHRPAENCRRMRLQDGDERSHAQ